MQRERERESNHKLEFERKKNAENKNLIMP